jgi:preprotein translocase subunit YajC
LQGGGFLIVLLLMFAVMYFLLIRPQRAKQRQMQEMLNRLAPGDEVITIGGIYGDVVDVDEEKVTLEIAEDVHIEVARRAVSQIVPQEQGFDSRDVDEAVEDETADEVAEPLEEPEPQPIQEEKRRGVFGRRSG